MLHAVLVAAAAALTWLVGRLAVRLFAGVFPAYPWVVGLLAPFLLSPAETVACLAYPLGIPAGIGLARRQTRGLLPARQPRRFVPFLIIAGVFHGSVHAVHNAGLSRSFFSRVSQPDTFLIVVGLGLALSSAAGRYVFWPTRPHPLDFTAPAAGWAVRRGRAYRRIARLAQAVRAVHGTDEEHALFTLSGAEEFLSAHGGRHTGPSEALDALFHRVNLYHACTGVLLNAGPERGGFALAMRQLLEQLQGDVGAGRYSVRGALRALRLLQAEAVERLPAASRRALAAGAAAAVTEP